MENQNNQSYKVAGESPESESLSPETRPRASNRKRWIALVAALVITGAVALALVMRSGGSNAGEAVPAPSFDTVTTPSNEASNTTSPRAGEIVLTISAEQLENTQIKTEAAAALLGAPTASEGDLRTTGTVQSNAYKETPVFPIAGGIVREVKAELGDKVRQEKALAIVFSTELAEAQAAYLKIMAELEEHHQHYKRTVELLEIGAVSREELEQVTAMHKIADAKLASAQQQLILLGMTERDAKALEKPDQVKSLISVTAPVSGTIINRSVNPGEVVEKGKELFRIVDLSNVWVIGQVYENDFRSVNVGTQAVITTSAYPGRTFKGRVSYIDPRVDPQTRTAQVRVEVANPGEALRLGMFVDVSFGATAATNAQSAVTVPRSALQMMGAKPVVFVATKEGGVFVQREVSAGPEANGLVTLYSGVSAGERVVTDGSFFLRAESMKLNPAQSLNPAIAQAAEAAPVEQAPSAQETGSKIQAFNVLVTGEGFEPASIRLRRNVLARLTFVRQVEVTCGTEVVIPEYGINRDLPLNQPVVVEFTPEKRGEYSFACGMNMLRGKIIVQ